MAPAACGSGCCGANQRACLTMALSLRSFPLFFWPQLYLAPGSVLDAYRRAHEPERFADLVFQKTLVRKMQLHVLVSEKNKSGRRGVSLGHVEDLDLLPVGNGSAVEVHGFQEAVHLPGADALLPLGGNQFKRAEDFVDAFSRSGRDEDHGRVLQKLQSAACLLLIQVA